MRRRTTTKQLQQAITNNLLHITSAKKYSKSTHKSAAIDTDSFKDSLDFICESIFADCIGWHFERNHETGQYVAECGRMDGSTDFIIIAHLCVSDGVSVEDVERALLFVEE